jgi:hypothetical protein
VDHNQCPTTDDKRPIQKGIGYFAIIDDRDTLVLHSKPYDNPFNNLEEYDKVQHNRYTRQDYMLFTEQRTSQDKERLDIQADGKKAE